MARGFLLDGPEFLPESWNVTKASSPMKRTLPILALTAATALSLLAGPEDLVKQRAKNVRDQNNARQGVPGSPPPATSAPPPNSIAVKPAASKPTPTAKIRSDLMNWQNRKEVSVEARKEFAQDLLSAVRGSKSPSSSSLEKFAASLAAGLAGKTPGSSELSRLVQNINLALNSASLSEDRRDEIAAELEADLKTAGVSPAAASAAAADLKAIMADLSQ